MRVKYNNRQVEITDYDVGRHFDECCVIAANYIDGAMEDLTDDDLDKLTSEYESEIIQNAIEFSVDDDDYEGER